jgi:hypothetical protein
MNEDKSWEEIPPWRDHCPYCCNVKGCGTCAKQLEEMAEAYARAMPYVDANRTAPGTPSQPQTPQSPEDQ